MEAQVLSRSPAIVIHGVARAMESGSRALRAVALRVDAWLEARRRAARDRMDLTRMSDRELRDIGIDRGQVDAVADGWSR